MVTRQVLSRELFLYALDLEVKRARRSRYAFCLLKIKLSKPCGIEDVEGLQDCYQSLSNWVMGELREIDIIGFVADNELAVLLPYTDLAGCVRVRSRLERKLKYINFKTDVYELKIDQICFSADETTAAEVISKGGGMPTEFSK
jgi:PleD family two-component response regulator